MDPANKSSFNANALSSSPNSQTPVQPTTNPPIEQNTIKVDQPASPAHKTTQAQNTFPQNPSQAEMSALPDQKQKSDPDWSFYPKSTKPPKITRPTVSIPQQTQQYPAFEKVDSIPPSHAVMPQASSNDYTDTHAHYNAQQDAHVVAPSTQPIDSPKPKRSKKKLFGIFFVVIFLLGTIATSVMAWGVAYNKLTLGDRNAKAELAIKQVVYSLPFTKKPPEYLIAKSVKVHQDVTKQAFDVSFAIGSDELSDPLGVSQLDFQVKGDIDYTDPNNLLFNTEIFLTKGLNIEIKKKEKNVYFNIKDIPVFFLTFAGLSKSQFEPVLGKWVSWDTTPLDTEARRTIQDQETDYLSNEFSNEFFNEYVDDYLIENLTVSNDTVDGHSVYKISLDADKEMIDYIQRKLEETSNDSGKFSVLGYTADTPKMSDYIKTLKGEMFIDKSSYYTRKATLLINIEYDSEEFSDLGFGMSGSTGNSSASFAFAAKLDNFGEEVVVNEPNADMTSDEFMEKISEIVTEFYGNMFYGSPTGFTDAQSRAVDSQRKSDLLQISRALEMHYVECQAYPSSLEGLIEPECETSYGNYLTFLPKDPDDDSDYYYTSNATTYNLCAKLDIPPDSGDYWVSEKPCPDPSYNYHISSEDL